MAAHRKLDQSHVYLSLSATVLNATRQMRTSAETMLKREETRSWQLRQKLRESKKEAMWGFGLVLALVALFTFSSEHIELVPHDQTPIGRLCSRWGLVKHDTPIHRRVVCRS
jgi:hypothetical protein